MRILLVDQDCAPGHIAFNRLVLRQLRQTHDVQLATSPEYAERLGESSVHDLPGAAGRGEASGRRLLKAPALRAALRSAGSLVDRVLFLGFDPLLLPLICTAIPSHIQVLAFIHNQLRFQDGSLRCRYFGTTGRRVTYLGLEAHITRFLVRTVGVPAATVPHPYYHTPPRKGTATVDPGLILAPSRSNDPAIVERCALMLPDGWRIEARMPRAPAHPRIKVLDEIADYHARLASARWVLVAARMFHRVSGVAYEALAQGRPLLLPSAPFSGELHRQYPGSTTVLEEVSDLASVHGIPGEEHRRFLEERSPAAFGARLRAVLEAADGKAPG